MNKTNYKNRTWKDRCSRLFLFFVALVTSTLFSIDVNATTCGGAASIPAVPTLPYVAALTCSGANDITSANSTTCGSGLYKGGQEAVFVWTPTSSYTGVSIAYAGVSWTGIFLYNGCPTSGGTCIGNITSSGTSKTLSGMSVTAGNTYYIVIDTYPTPNSPCPGNMTLNGTIVSACTGTPTAGSISAPSLACSGTAFNMTLTGATSGTGIVYQWQSGPSGSGPWTDIGTNSASYSATQTTTTFYQVVVTCTPSGLSATTAAVSVGMNSLLNCYCASSHSSGCSGDAIVSATLNTLNNNTGATCPAAPAYSYYFAGVSQTTLYQGSSYSLVLTFGSDGNQYAGAWIDYDNNGTLDAGENIGLTGNAGSNGTATINFTVPPAATTAITRLRIIGGNDSPVTSGQACGASSSTWGETEDYDITIATPPACAGSPATGTANASETNVCPGGTTTLSVSGIGIETGYTYQWYNGAFNVIPGANTNPYVLSPTQTDTYYCLVTCSNGGGNTLSTGVTVTFDASADAGTISGPTSGSTFANLAYSTNAYVGNLQWQSATALAGPYSDIASATLDNVSLVSNAAGTFYVRLRAASPTCTTYSNVITIVVTIPNDNACNATAISTGNSGPYTNIGATGEVGEVSPPETNCNVQNGWCVLSNSVVNSVWFSFTAPPSGRVSIRLNPTLTLFDSQFALYAATNCADFGTYTLIAANDDSLNSPYNSYIAPKCLVPGATYYLKVDGYQSTTNGNWGILLTEETSVLPTAAISGTQAICNGNSANLSIAFTGASSWTYSVNGGAPVTTSSNPETVIVSPNTSTSYTITSLSDANCPSGSTSGTAAVQVDNAPPANSVYISSAPLSACVGNVVTINTNSVISATTYTWTVPSGTLVNGVAGPANTAVPTANLTLGAVPANASGWEVCVSASNACGVTNTNCTKIRGVLSTPSPVVGSTNACPNASGAYSTTAVAGAASYAWSITGDASVSGTGTAITVNFGPAFTSGTLCVRAQLACGYQSAQRCISITNGTSTPGLMTGTFAVCPGQNGLVYSIPVVANASTYSWTVPANVSIVSGQGTNSITVNAGAGFTLGNICVTATSPCGVVSAPRCKTVSSTNPGTPGNITGAASGVCNSTVTHSVPAAAGITSYTWAAPSGATIVTGQGTNTVDVSYSGSFTTGQLCVTANNACGSSTARCINVKGKPSDPGAISGQSTACAGEQGLSFSVATVFGASSYNWSLPVGASIVAGAGTSNIIVDWGNVSGSVIVSVTNACGTSGARTFSVFVNCRTSGSELPGAIVSAYPNPVSSKLTVDVQSDMSGSYSIELSDLAGRLVLVDNIQTIEGMNSHTMNVSDLSKGVYMLSIKNAEGFAKQIRIAVE